MYLRRNIVNFCVSGYATNWYYHLENEPEKISLLRSPKLLLKYHWGSVAGGSLMLGFFYFFDFFLDFFCSNDRDVSKKNIERQPFHKDVLDYPEDGEVKNKTIAFCNLVLYKCNIRYAREGLRPDTISHPSPNRPTPLRTDQEIGKQKSYRDLILRIVKIKK